MYVKHCDSQVAARILWYYIYLGKSYIVKLFMNIHRLSLLILDNVITPYISPEEIRSIGSLGSNVLMILDPMANTDDARATKSSAFFVLRFFWEHIKTK